jgi:hypothetical protein
LRNLASFRNCKTQEFTQAEKTNIAEFSQFAELKIFEEYLIKIHIFGKHRTMEKTEIKITLANTLYKKLLYLT